MALAGADAVALNHLEVTSIGNEVTLTDRIDRRKITLRPDIVVNATGAWIDHTNVRACVQEDMVQGTKRAHLVLDHPDLRERLGDDLVYYENTDGRICIMFCPHGIVLIGSSDVKVPDPAKVRYEADDHACILEGLARVFPGLTVLPEQVFHALPGCAPCPSVGRERPARSHAGISTAGSSPRSRCSA